MLETECKHLACRPYVETIKLRTVSVPELTETRVVLDCVLSYASKQEQKAWILANRAVSSQGGVTTTTKLNAHLSGYRRCEGFVCGPSVLIRRMQSFGEVLCPLLCNLGVCNSSIKLICLLSKQTNWRSVMYSRNAVPMF